MEKEWAVEQSPIKPIIVPLMLQGRQPVKLSLYTGT